jgi:two-component system, OmpR family, alkaline phosphatase synthesis response regulator PhoP
VTDEAATVVLVASGDEGLRAQVALTLGDDRYQVIEADDTEAAIVAIATQLPPLLVLDAALEGAGALAIAKSIRAQPETAGSRVLVLTTRGDGAPADAPGVDATLALPFTSLALLRKNDTLQPAG